MQLITDKFSVPTQSTPHLKRERLLKILQASITNHLSTLIVGRAGTGKSALVADMARVCSSRVAWLKAEASDSEYPVFIEYLVGSVKKQRPEFNSEKLLKIVASLSVEDISKTAEAFINELVESGNEPLLVVLDDLHHIYDSDWAVPFLNRLLSFLPPEVHFILIGRSTPPAPLWRMRSKQTLNVIDEKMLALAPEEAMKLFMNYGLTAAKAFLVNEDMHGRIGDVNTVASYYRERKRTEEINVS